MTDQETDSVDNGDVHNDKDGGEDRNRSDKDRRISQRRQGSDIEYLKQAEDRRKSDRREGEERRKETLDRALNNMLEHTGPSNMDKILKIVFTRVIIVIAMALLLYHIATYFIIPQELFRGNFDNIEKNNAEDLKK